ncbi:MAG: transposase [Actinobacteria bacterium]|nr:transposase [Actinomycetota bacterium]
MSEVITIAQRPKWCVNVKCAESNKMIRSVRWQQVAPIWCTYGYDVIAQIGWQRQMQRQTFSEVHLDLQASVRISETQVRAMYTDRYLALLACHERQQMEQLKTIASQNGLWLSLDGLAPEGGEAQLWLVRELQSGVTLRCGWMSQQDQTAFENFLQPIAKLGLPVTVVMSDKQRGLVPAVAEVFSGAKHSFCQMHYLGNAAEPISAADEAMKIELRQGVRREIGMLIRQEKIEKQGVLTVTGGIPSPVILCGASSDPAVEEQEAIFQDLSRRIRYLLTLKGRPPFCLAGIEMFERLTEVKDCLERLIHHHSHPQLVQLQQGLCAALQPVQSQYMLLRQTTDWLEHIADLLDPAEKPLRSAAQVQKSLFAYLNKIKTISAKQPSLQPFFQTIQKTTLSYAPGLFHSYDIPGLPRTNNARESDFRNLNRRLLRTTGQKGLTRRLIQRSGAWELLHRPASLQDTVLAFNRVVPKDFHEERLRLRQHRDRFRLHTRSTKQSHLQLTQLEHRWVNLSHI